VSDGQEVRVISRYGTAHLPVNVTSAVNPGEVFATFQSPAAALNEVTGPHRDERVGTPEYKLTAVRLDVRHDLDVPRDLEARQPTDEGRQPKKTSRRTR